MRGIEVQVGGFYEIEWDRTQEVMECVVLSISPDGLAVVCVDNGTLERGTSWIRKSEVTDVSVIEAEDFLVRSVKFDQKDAIYSRRFVHGGFLDLLQSLVGEFVGVCGAEFGSSKLLCGRVKSIASHRVDFDEINTDSRLTGDLLTYKPDENISLEWNSEYLANLVNLL